MKRFIEIFATFASIISLATVGCIPNFVKLAIAGIGCIGFIFLIYDFYIEGKVNEVVCTSDEQIKDTMKTIIKTQGKICIVSRDLSWVDAEIEHCISIKSNSMLIFAEKPNPVTEILTQKGVEFKYYGNLKFEPKTRFTMIRYNARNPQVAIANIQNSIRKKGSTIKHTIYQTEEGNKHDAWINSLASDLIQLCNLTCYGEIYDEHKSE